MQRAHRLRRTFAGVRIWLHADCSLIAAAAACNRSACYDTVNLIQSCYAITRHNGCELRRTAAEVAGR